jgi:hypothetical protein
MCVEVYTPEYNNVQSTLACLKLALIIMPASYHTFGLLIPVNSPGKLFFEETHQAEPSVCAASVSHQ